MIKFDLMLAIFARTLALSLSLGFIGVASAGEFYRWVDRNGVVHFTDDPRDIPSEQRDSLSRIHFRSEPRAPEGRASALPTRASVPIEKHGQVMVIQATINHKTQAKFVVDTGASFTMISSATAKELAIDGAPSQQTMPFQTANGVIQAPLTKLESVMVGGMEIKNVTAAIHDAIPDTQVAGLLGLNFLSNFRMDIDTQKGLLHLEKK
ncbi:MAG TPA: TIGR02281 family clan AA aspartic protease [Terriglobales bacterium]|nr:TIGR02281 family clan AA aspartic protease [Terriglobales bacterium]